MYIYYEHLYSKDSSVSKVFYLTLKTKSLHTNWCSYCALYPRHVNLVCYTPVNPFSKLNQVFSRYFVLRIMCVVLIINRYQGELTDASGNTNKLLHTCGATLPVLCLWIITNLYYQQVQKHWSNSISATICFIPYKRSTVNAASLTPVNQ